MPKLTKRTVEALAPRPADFTAWDNELAGFGVRVHPKGRKTFVLKYRVGGGRNGAQRRLSLGTFGAVTVDQARSLARQAYADVVKGGDPAGQRADHRRAVTLDDFSRRYLEDHARPKKSASSAAEDERLLNKHILPKLATRKVIDLTTADVAKLVQGLATTPIIANRVRALLSKMLSLAAVWGVRTADAVNPARAVEKFPEQSHERYLSMNELQRLGKALSEAERLSTECWQGIAAIRLLLLSGCRRSEILTLRWEYIDWERGIILLPESKTGRKTVYLSAPLRAVLDSLPSKASAGYVLPDRYGAKRRRDGPTAAVVGELPPKPFNGIGHIWRRIANDAGLRPLPPKGRRRKSNRGEENSGRALVHVELAPVRLHDLRHTFASKGVGVGLSLRLIGGLLGHSSPLTTDRYAHLAADPVRQGAERIASAIASDLAGTSAEIIPLPALARA